MKYFLSFIICLAVFSCTNHKEIEKKHSPSPLFRLFNIYETPDYDNNILKEIKGQQRTRTYAKIDIGKDQFRRCFKETFNDNRASLLLKNELNIIYVEMFVSKNGKVMGMRIKTPKESDITDNEIKALSRNLYNIKVHNINDYPVTVSEQFSFSKDYFVSK